jgi:hypothetical protein
MQLFILRQSDRNTANAITRQNPTTILSPSDIASQFYQNLRHTFNLFLGFESSALFSS